MQDHPLVAGIFSVNSSLPNSGTLDDTIPARDVNGTVAAMLLNEWMETGGGLYTDTGSNTIGFVRFAEGNQNTVNSKPGIFKFVGDGDVVPNAPGLGPVAGVAGQDPSPGKRSAHYEMLFRVSPCPAHIS